MSFINKLKAVGIVPLLYKLKYRYFSNNTELLNLSSRLGAYDYLLRYRSAIGNYSEQSVQPAEPVLWTCWLQGEDQAPLLVQRCWQSMRKHAEGRKLIILTQETIPQYVDVPDYIEKKHQEGIIPHAHYTDIVRLLLLIKYGGVWIDSTIMMLGKLPEYITDSSLFCFHSDGWGHIELANNFLASHKNHPLLCGMRDILFSYWRKENRLVSYSLFHLCWSIVIHLNPENERLWMEVPMISSQNEKQLLDALNESYSAARLEEFRQSSPLQKLSYKLQEFNIHPEYKGTFYDVLINQNESLC